ncbi:MAG: hypothetical protein KDC85_20035 [Saprospiraceae bacterium]|nr:hypothetical protein [Saprospiraceae bacterium]MCB9327049.1 hypothetical protein [Lewinellaceae bacterium]
MLRIFNTILFAAILWVPVEAQLPKSNIYLFEVKQVSDSAYNFNNAKWLTYFNESGYNNQPAFFSPTQLYISVQTPKDSQTDLYMLDLSTNTKVKVTETPEGEFSAQRMLDYYSFSAIRQEYTGRDTLLRLWQFPIDRLSKGQPVFKYLTNVGYYYWLNGTEVAVCIVDNPNYLAIANTRTDEVTPLATNVGRCFQKLPNGNLVYVQKGEYSDNWYLLEKNLYHPEQQPRTIIETLKGCEDFALFPDGTFVMGRGSKLFKFNQFTDEDWVEIADLRYYDIRNISRLAISPDFKIAIVAD